MWKSCTANFRVNISTSTAEIVLVGICEVVMLIFLKGLWAHMGICTRFAILKGTTGEKQGWLPIGLFKMFSRWILHIFTSQIQSEQGHKFM